MVCKVKRMGKFKQGQRAIQVKSKIPEHANPIRVVLAHVCLITQY